MRMPSVRNERGIALVVAITALVVIGAIVAGTFFISTLEQRTAVNGVQATQAFEAADAGLQNAVANWSSSYNSLATYSSQVVSTASYGAAVDTVVVTRLNSNMFHLVSTATSGGAVQTLGAVLKMITSNPDVQAAVTARGDVTVGGNATVRGQETAPPNWTCAAAADRAGIRTSGTVSTSGNSYTLTGNPATTQNDAAVTSSLFTTPFDQLRQLTTMTIASGNYNGMAPTTTGSPARCNSADQNNWGEPWRSPTGGTVTQCTTYSPVIYVPGNLSLQNGRGQGILLINGYLEIRGNVEWTGLIIAIGHVDTRGTGSKITGAVMANDVDLAEDNSLLGNPTVAYSRCAIDYVLQQASVARPVAARPWFRTF